MQAIRKPAFWLTIVAAIIAVFLVLLLADPIGTRLDRIARYLENAQDRF